MERQKMIQKICDDKAEALILIGYRLNNEFPLEASKRKGYTPDIISNYEFLHPEFKHDFIKGLLLTKSGKLTRRAVRLSIALQETKGSPMLIELPVEFLNREKYEADEKH